MKDYQGGENTKYSENDKAKGIGRSKKNNVKMNTKFRGAVEKMNGNVFTLHSEGQKTGQFDDMLEALRVLIATEFKKEVTYLEPIFRKLEEPHIPLPTKPIPVKLEKGQESD